MYEWVEVADRLRTVQTAEIEFVMRSLVEQTIIGPVLLDRLAADVLEGCDDSTAKWLEKQARWDDES